MHIERYTKKFGDLAVFDDFSVEFYDGKINCIMGPSGCGKTTLLNAVAGLDGGKIQSTANISYIFQEPRLLPWKRIRQNIMIALPDTLSKSEKRERAEKYLTAVGLEKFMNYFPIQLSGGMRQRAAIARAFAVPCDLLLMDEPFNGQDMKTKDELIRLFLKLWKDEPKTVIAVTHSFSEAWLLGDRTIVLTKAPARIAADINCFTPREIRAANVDCGEAKILRQKIEEAFDTSPPNPRIG
ncbi:MAG TPA: ABC transporter ATP-binding protein [Oscillospiraceae bacterium]|nr:ABC transporter ATP-binding protein [Oscillospiraceae bacterium]HPK34339.1 ABC transporter ATP-binding protein [Oscillospiraceae bacterium]HPR75118.1 ABC transporter ATP-binding protein [Oscillospiraceae bacterium]